LAPRDGPSCHGPQPHRQTSHPLHHLLVLHFIRKHSKATSVTPQPMLPQTFHLFPFFPLEIRFQIYLHANPSRFIHIREQFLDEPEDFLEHVATNLLPADFKLHPSLSHFAHEWRHTIPRRSTTTQTTLPRFGFTTSKPISRPWTPSPKCPEIRLRALIDCSAWVLWELCRKSYLYSSAPIPAFLHVSAESRRFLRGYGYELGFSTRSEGPRTWVCWKGDVVYLQTVDEDYDDRLLSRERWDWVNLCLMI
jgi:hypothetical protein